MYKLVLIDDELHEIKQIERLIHRITEEFDVISFTNSFVALNYIKSNKTDVIVTDIRMPNMDGISLIKEISRINADIKIIILSGYAEFDYAKEAMSCGVKYYLEKPISKGQLARAFEEILDELQKNKYLMTASYGCASDRQQASIVFDVAVDMVEQCPALKKRIKPIMSVKRLVYKPTNSFYQVLSSEAFTKHGLNVHGVIFDELHAQPNRDLFDVMTMGSGDARTQPLFFLITTAGTDRESICFEQHQKALDILEGRKIDPTFYPVIYGLPDTEDWTKEENWYKANPSLGHTIDIEKVRNACLRAMENPAEENLFRQLRLNQWVKQSTRWMPMEKWDDCDEIIDIRYLKGRECYAGLDLSTTLDLTAFVLIFPPRNDTEKYIILPYFWIPEDNLKKRVNRDHVPYDVWEAQGHIRTTPGNVVDYRWIEEDIKRIASEFVIKEIAYDRYNATQIILNLMDEGLTMVPFGQGFKDMSPSTKELFTLVLKNKIIHNMHPVLRWNFDNVCVETDAAENIKPSKKKSTERIDGAVATVMGLDRAVRNMNANTSSVYDERGIVVL